MIVESADHHLKAQDASHHRSKGIFVKQTREKRTEDNRARSDIEERDDINLARSDIEERDNNGTDGRSAGKALKPIESLLCADSFPAAYGQGNENKRDEITEENDELSLTIDGVRESYSNFSDGTYDYSFDDKNDSPSTAMYNILTKAFARQTASEDEVTVEETIWSNNNRIEQNIEDKPTSSDVGVVETIWSEELDDIMGSFESNEKVKASLVEPFSPTVVKPSLQDVKKEGGGKALGKKIQKVSYEQMKKEIAALDIIVEINKFEISSEKEAGGGAGKAIGPLWPKQESSDVKESRYIDNIDANGFDDHGDRKDRGMAVPTDIDASVESESNSIAEISDADIEDEKEGGNFLLGAFGCNGTDKDAFEVHGEQEIKDTTAPNDMLQKYDGEVSVNQAKKDLTALANHVNPERSTLAKRIFLKKKGFDSTTRKSKIPARKAFFKSKTVKKEEKIPIRNLKYDAEGDGHRLIMYTAFHNDPIACLETCQYSSAPCVNKNTDDVLVKVEASTVSYSDCVIRKGMWWGASEINMPVTPGVDFVGKVCSIGNDDEERYNLKTGDSVAALVRCGGNSRYITVDAKQLVKVPNDLSPPSAACIIETYLAAFQSLHLGEFEQTRYTKNSLLDKNILIVGGITMVGQAMIELAFLAGASNVYVSGKPNHHDFFSSLGATPLPLDVDDWLPLIEGCMDLVVDIYCTDELSGTSRALNAGGRLVRIQPKPKPTEQVLNSSLMAFLAAASACAIDSRKIFQESRISFYDVYESWDDNINLSKQDLAHLFEKVKSGVIDPPIVERIPLSKVPEVHVMLEAKRIQGFYICEPWLRTPLL